VLNILDDRLILRWSIDGPRKAETIEYVYAATIPPDGEQGRS
jgi:hypothetical protein